MGLDITAYRKLTQATNVKIDEYGDIEDWENHFNTSGRMEESEKHWPGRGDGISKSAIYTFSDKFKFRAGSYSGYGRWRKMLDQDLAKNLEFKELIEFSDCENVIDPIVTAKLLKNFNARMRDAEAIGGEFFELYQDWRKAFEFAADGGAVDFH